MHLYRPLHKECLLTESSSLCNPALCLQDYVFSVVCSLKQSVSTIVALSMLWNLYHKPFTLTSLIWLLKNYLFMRLVYETSKSLFEPSDTDSLFKHLVALCSKILQSSVESNTYVRFIPILCYFNI